MLAYLTLTSGSRSGSNYLLDPKIQNQIGRGLDCQIILTDPLSSRVHAVVWFDEDGWWARDAGSRNGTFLNGQKIDEVRLVDGCLLKIGDAEFSFRMDDRRPDKRRHGFVGAHGNDHHRHADEWQRYQQLCSSFVR